ncbi:Choline-sulfatase [Rubripirellula lacrimiformis]|uniref:Choline-sulfatase n=1 Tax=Rubripirellula lacrimiformis TaxID=1930273 RepID=A0A517NFL5_9BACT|nr:sulfatase [Rubripirellula lacrimiformis]QDT05924.1 Choline-sulfatase [Rubripirellula lacrimiformis]
MTRCFVMLWIAACLTWTEACPCQADDPVRKPNILWIVGENFDLDFGCYGAANVATPNVDRLADEGIRYTNVFSTSPVCAPSRSAFMTGMYQTTTDTHHMRSHRDDGFRLPEGVRPITHRLQDAGYFTANIRTVGDATVGDATVGTGKLDLNFTREGDLYDSDDWSKLKDHQPFFAQINMPEAEYDIYDRKSAEKDRVRWVGEEWHPQIATPQNVSLPPYYPDHPIARSEWARYLNSVSGTDVRIGNILKQLDADGLTEDTVIVFFADNGRLEARGIHWCWDSGLHVPMVIRWPANHQAPPQYAAGKVSDELVSLIDLTASTLTMAGIEPPVVMQGRSFWGTPQTPPRRFVFSARDRIDETEIRLRSVRGKRFHYIRNFTPGAGFSTLNRYKEKCFLVKPLMRQLLAQGKLTGPPAELMQPFPDEMLYDTEADPFEINNLADSSDPQHQSQLQQMRSALDTWMAETHDRGAIPEARSIVEPFTQEMHDWFGTPAWYSPE